MNHTPSDSDFDVNTDATRDELYALAQQHEIDGRSRMSKSELRDALRLHVGSRNDLGASRFEDFQRLAEAAAAGEFVMRPRMLSGNNRRHHVRQTLREDHQDRISRHSAGAQEKFDKLSDSLFSFFRGTALLFYRDMAGDDAWMPTVLVLGDVHPGNFGLMPNAHNTPIFSVNDFDEACYAPFTWDLKRGATGFLVAAKEIGGCGRKKRRKIAARFIRGYIDGMRRFADDKTEQDHEVRHDNAPKLIRELFEDAYQDRAEWLDEDYLDEFKRGFRSDDELVPQSDRRDEFQDLVTRLVSENDIQPPPRAGQMRVKDVAIRRGQGTASLGLPRYYVLIEGPNGDGSDDLILEFKRARRSALAGLTPPSRYGFDVPGNRVRHAQSVQLTRGDLFFGSVEFEGMSFLSRERAPFRDDMDLDDLSSRDWKRYAEFCGETLAHAHALSDEMGEIEHDVEPKIVEAIGSPPLFIEDIVGFAEEATEQVRRDHKTFCADHELGAFRAIDQIFR